MPCTSSLGPGLGAAPGALRHVVADTNPARIAVPRRRVGGQGYAAGDVPRMLDREKVDVLLVSSVDATHDTYIVAGLEAGCHVITEKPMTVEPARCRRILDAQCQTGRRVTAAFNYRYAGARHGYARVYERLAANQSLATQRSVHAHDVLDLIEWES